MEQFKPNDIPEIIELFSELYNSRGKVLPTLEQKLSRTVRNSLKRAGLLPDPLAT